MLRWKPLVALLLLSVSALQSGTDPLRVPDDYRDQLQKIPTTGGKFQSLGFEVMRLQMEMDTLREERRIETPNIGPLEKQVDTLALALDRSNHDLQQTRAELASVKDTLDSFADAVCPALRKGPDASKATLFCAGH